MCSMTSCDCREHSILEALKVAEAKIQRLVEALECVSNHTTHHVKLDTDWFQIGSGCLEKVTVALKEANGEK